MVVASRAKPVFGVGLFGFEPILFKKVGRLRLPKKMQSKELLTIFPVEDVPVIRVNESLPICSMGKERICNHNNCYSKDGSLSW